MSRALKLNTTDAAFLRGLKIAVDPTPDPYYEAAMNTIRSLAASHVRLERSEARVRHALRRSQAIGRQAAKWTEIWRAVAILALVGLGTVLLQMIQETKPWA